MKCIITVAFFVSAISTFAQGPLTPPGAPGPSMKTLEQLEPRRAISSVPFSITAPGSYYLITNLTGTAGSVGISITTSDVTLDLNGFALMGVASSLSGIQVPAGRERISIFNGHLRSWGGNGITSGANGMRVLNINAETNGGWGISITGGGAVVDRCVARNNDLGGIRASRADISECVSIGNLGTGIDAGQQSVVRGCSLVNNRSEGIGCNESTVVNCTVSGSTNGIVPTLNSTIINCTVNNNTNGILGSSGCSVIGCTVNDSANNGISLFTATVVNCTVFNSGNDGISVGIGSTVKDCTVRGSGNDGIEGANDGAYLNNTLTSNGLTTTNGAGIHMTLPGNRIEGNHLVLNDIAFRLEVGPNLVIRNSLRVNGQNVQGSGNSVHISGDAIGSSPHANLSF